MILKWVLLDDEGQPVRYFSYPAVGSIAVKEKTYTVAELIELNGECLL